MSRATETVAPPNLSCHPERSEGSLCPASQTQSSRGGVTIDGMPPGDRGGRPGTSS